METTNPEPTEKVCSKCKQAKPISEFYLRKDRRPGLYHAWCRSCHAEGSREYQRSDRGRATRIGRVYSLAIEDYHLLLSNQGNACAICDEPFSNSRPHVDHCHDRGTVRGLLCGGCNKAIGLFRDDPVRLQRAIDYLARSRAVDAA